MLKSRIQGGHGAPVPPVPPPLHAIVNNYRYNRYGAQRATKSNVTNLIMAWAVLPSYPGQCQHVISSEEALGMLIIAGEDFVKFEYGSRHALVQRTKRLDIHII